MKTLLGVFCEWFAVRHRPERDLDAEDPLLAPVHVVELEEQHLHAARHIAGAVESP